MDVLRFRKHRIRRNFWLKPPATRNLATMPKHSWEEYDARQWEAQPNPDNDFDSFWGECSDDEFEAESSSPGQMLVSLLLEHMLYGRISSRQCCSMMYWAEKAGVSEAKPYALNPSSTGGHAARKLRTALGHGVKCDDLYEAEVCGHSRHDLDRSAHVVSFLPLHEQLEKSFETDTQSIPALQALKAAGDVPEAYTSHSVVQAYPDEHVVPIAIFMDAVPYSITDSVLGCWALNVITGHRFLYGVLRKRHTCRCGCRGWCSFDTLFRITAWCIEALAKKEWPMCRHTGEAWRPSDKARGLRGGQAMSVRCACIYVKGDWAEYAHTFGLTAWNDGLRSCFSCSGFGPDLFVHAGNTVDGLRWPVNEPGDYEAACERCETKVMVTTAVMLIRIAGFLAWQKAGKGGRCLTRDMPEHGLRAGDRLEPSNTCPDVGAMADLEVPVELVFWRSSEESICRHRNPMFRADIGVLCEHSMTVDTLHALYLGVMLVWCRITIWAIISSGVYGGNGTSDGSLTIVCLALRAALFNWYRHRHESHPGEVLTQVNDFPPSMVGKNAHRRLKTKAAETWALLLFLQDELVRFGVRIADCPRLLAAGKALSDMVFLWKRCTWVISRDVAEVRSITTYEKTKRLKSVLWLKLRTVVAVRRPTVHPPFSPRRPTTCCPRWKPPDPAVNRCTPVA